MENAIKAVLLMLFGASWRTSLVGLVAAVVTAATTYLMTQPGAIWPYVASALAYLVGRFFPDAKALPAKE